MEHQKNSVKVVEVCKVAPPPTSPLCFATPPPESLPLTFFDLLWLRFEPVERLFFYEISNVVDTSFFNSVLIPKLKTSLSIALQQFLPLAGNISWPQDSPNPILTYVPGDNVSLTIAESNQADDFYHLSSSNDFVEAKEYHPLIPQLEVSHERAVAMALQVTIFPNRGISIGTSMHHAILDGKTSTMFMKSWAHICKHESNLLPDQLQPFFDRRVIKDPAGLQAIYLNQFLNMNRPNNRSLMATQVQAPLPDPIRGTFVFTRTKIEALRQLVKEKKQHVHQSIHLSTFCLTFAYTWVCLVKAEEITAEKVSLVFSADCRSRLDPPIPANYFGNCIAGRLVVAETKRLLGEDGFCVAVNAISKAIKSLDEEGILNGAESWIPLIYSESKDRRLFSVAGSPQFHIYDTDFGWGRPKKVAIVSIEGTGAISLSESKDGGGGVEVGLVLLKHHMEAFATLFAQGLGNLI